VNTKIIAVILDSILHNVGVVIVGLIFGLIGNSVDLILGLHDFRSSFTVIVGILFIFIGFFIRVWAAFYFYKNQMKVISLIPQKKLITSGPFRFSRNPLYVGGNIFIFLGFVLFFGSPSGVVLTIINIIVVDYMIKREEKQLEKTFGKEWIEYKKRVRRWI
jgi:protein-S-isoprenylcysteine O-methyltransferase Ste14